MHRSEHGDLALLEQLARLDIAIRGVADHPARAPASRLLIDQRYRVMAVLPPDSAIAVRIGVSGAAAACSL